MVIAAFLKLEITLSIRGVPSRVCSSMRLCTAYLTETQDMDSWEALFERDRLSGKVAGASQDNPIDLCSLDTQERDWISAYGAREMANTQATGNSQLSEEVAKREYRAPASSPNHRFEWG
jgi:hypothetical protein